MNYIRQYPFFWNSSSTRSLHLRHTCAGASPASWTHAVPEAAHHRHPHKSTCVRGPETARWVPCGRLLASATSDDVRGRFPGRRTRVHVLMPHNTGPRGAISRLLHCIDRQSRFPLGRYREASTIAACFHTKHAVRGLGVCVHQAIALLYLHYFRSATRVYIRTGTRPSPIVNSQLSPTTSS
jgi:hypothetical protein